MFNGPNTRADRILDPLGGLGVGHHEAPGRGRLLDQHFQLGGAEMRVPRTVAGREHATRGGYLDHVCALPHKLADATPHLVGPINDPRGRSWVHRHEVETVARRHRAVPVAARLREHPDGDLHPRTGNQSGLDRRLDAQVGTANIADRGGAGAERRTQVLGGLVEAQRERRLGMTPKVDVADGDMDVTVEETGQDRQPRNVDLVVSVQSRADVANQSVLNDDVGFAKWRAGAIEEPAAAKKHASPEDPGGHPSEQRKAK